MFKVRARGTASDDREEAMAGKDYSICWIVGDIIIYRIMLLERFMDMLKNEHNVLVSPSLWNDPLETAYSRSILVRGDDEKALDGSHWFGQCWSFCEESALMWQSFAKPDSATRYVKIKTTANDLVKNFVNNDDILKIRVFDYVQYYKPVVDDYRRVIEHVKSLHGWPVNMIKHGAELTELFPLYQLLTKRDVFQHEDEGRFLIYVKDVNAEQKTFEYKVNPKKLVKDVILDPWTPQNEVAEITSEIRKYLPDNGITIKKSTLYDDYVKFTIKYSI